MAELPPVADAHCHLNPAKGLGPKLVGKRFREEGGWYLGVVCLSPTHMGLELSLEGYERAFRALAESCRALGEVGVKYRLHLGFHPAEVDKLAELGLSLSEVVELGRRVIDLACSMIREDVAHGLGEVGVQHYETAPERVEAALEVTRYAIARASELGVPVHLHLNQRPSTVATVRRIAVEEGCDLSRLVVHHASLEVLPVALSSGFSATVVGKVGNLAEACRRGLLALAESDYLDDPRRPGAVMVPWSLPRSWRRALRRGFCSEEHAYRANIDEVARLYGVAP